MSIINKPIAFLGGGHITEIIIENLTKSKTVSPRLLMVSDPDAGRRDLLSRLFAVQTTHDNGESVRHGDYVFVNVRPQVVERIVDDLLQSSIGKGKVIVTLAAGVPMKTYGVLGEEQPIVRALPNPPSQVGQGIAALAFNAHVTGTQREDILTLFEALGEVALLDEDCINTATALSSPAAIYMFCQSMIDAGVRMGLDRATATKITHQTIVGAMEVWKERRVPPNELMNEACTPGGISVECVFTLDKFGFRAAVSEAIRNGTIKAEQLGG